MKQNQNKNHSIFIYALTLAICILAANMSIPVAAKAKTPSKKLSISHSSMKMNPAAKKKLTVKNAQQKVKWSSSNRKIAVITAKTGKYKNKAVIHAKKTGTCTITVKSGSLKRKCKIHVLENDNSRNNNTKPNTDSNSDSNNNTNADIIADTNNNANTDIITDAGNTTAGIQFESVSTTENSIAVTVKIYNNTKQQIYYGLGCCIEKQIDGKWNVLETTEPMIVPSIACIVKENSSQSQTFQITKLKNPVTNGNYRITLSEMSKPEPPLLMTVINSATFQITDRTDTGTTPANAPVPSIIPLPSATATPTTAPAPSVSPLPSGTPAPILSPEKAGVRMTLSDINYNYSDNRISVKMTVQNNSTSAASLSRNYHFEKWENGDWQPVLPKEPLIVTADMIILPDYGQIYEETCTIITKEALAAGNYRFVRPGIFCEDPEAVIEKTAEFMVK